VKPIDLVHPAYANSQLARWYVTALADGAPHEEIMSEMEETFGLPHAWRDALTPFCGAFIHDQRRIGWYLNYLLVTLLLLLLIMDYLTLRDVLPFVEIGETIAAGFFVDPALSALKLVREIAYIVVALTVLRQVLKRTGVEEKLIVLYEHIANRMSNISQRVSARAADSRTARGGAAYGIGSGYEGQRPSKRASVQRASVKRASIQRASLQRASLQKATSSTSVAAQEVAVVSHGFDSPEAYKM